MNQSRSMSMAIAGDVTKLLGTSFGLTIETKNTSQFLYNKVHKKLNYQTATYLSLARRALVINSILLSNFWFFFSIWRESLEVIRKITSFMCQYLRIGSESRCIYRVTWTYVCIDRNIGSLNIVDAKEVLHVLIEKWIFKVLEPGESSLQCPLLYCILNIISYERGNQRTSLHWVLTTNFHALRRSQVWNRIARSWKKLIDKIECVSPQSCKEVLTTNLWCTRTFIGHYFGFIATRAIVLQQRS